MGVHRNVAGVLAAEFGFRRSVLQKVAGHPVVLARTGQILDGLSKVSPMELGSPFSRGRDQSRRKSLIKRHRDEGGLAITGNPFDADSPGIDRRFRFQVIERPRGTPRPGSERSPIVRFAGLAEVRQPDDSTSQPGPVVGLDAGWIQDRIAPAGLRQNLLSRRAGRSKCRPRRSTTSSKSKPAKHDERRHGLARVLGNADFQRDLDFNLRASRVINHPFQSLFHDRHVACRDFLFLDDFPSHLRRVAGNSSNHILLEKFDDFRTTPGNPLVLGFHDGSVTANQQLRKVGKGIRECLIKIRMIRCRFISTRTGTQLGDPKLLKHVPMIVHCRKCHDARWRFLLSLKRIKRERSQT